MSFQIKRLSPFGLQVELNLNVPLSPTMAAELRALYAEHHLLLFRGHTCDMDQLLRFARHFGPLASTNGTTLGHLISNCRPDDGYLGASEICFHSDLSYSPCPYDGAILQAIDVVDGASATRFASGARAYDQLPESTRRRVSGLQTLMVWGLDPTRRNRNSQVPPHYPRTVKPLVWTHPVTGRECLYLDYNSTDSILGLPAEESEALLQELWGIELAPDNIYEHFWRVGDTILWDNMALLHARGDMSQVGNRTLQRATIAKVGYIDMFPHVDLSGVKGKLDIALGPGKPGQAS